MIALAAGEGPGANSASRRRRCGSGGSGIFLGGLGSETAGSVLSIAGSTLPSMLMAGSTIWSQGCEF